MSKTSIKQAINGYLLKFQAFLKTKQVCIHLHHLQTLLSTNVFDGHLAHMSSSSDEVLY